MSPRIPLEISGYLVLPVALPAVPSFLTSTTHYMYLRRHEPKLPDPDAARSLFLVNIPVTTTETHLRHLFGFQLSAGRVERVEFQDSPFHKPVEKPSTKPQKKRKRVTPEEIEIELESLEWPSTWNRDLHRSGAHAVVVFVDRASMEASFIATKRAAKAGTKIVWGDGIESKLPPLYPERYATHHRLTYPTKKALLQHVDAYMTTYGRLEEARTQAEAKKRQVPDEDGFITVTRGGGAAAAARQEELREAAERQKKKSEGLEDFYRFQTREKRKERQGELVRKFEEDRMKVEEMRRRRGGVKPE